MSDTLSKQQQPAEVQESKFRIMWTER